MEGDISKQNPTESAISSASHTVFPCDQLFDLNQQIFDCLTNSYELLDSYKQHISRRDLYK